ncbi:unnamed protein product [Zymoseptoria tritici ST99CH_3D1]|nr:unnamed protein product [Zymoseptoria tritici ST99CH_3D1]
MSAAGPLPSPSSASNPQNGASRSHPTNGGERVFAHVKDLQEDALTDFSPSQSIGQLLDRAERALKQAKSSIDFRRPDHAFTEYLRAYEITVEVIPRHRDYIHFMHDQHGEQKLQVLQRRISAMADQFQSIKKIIINNNSRFGVLPRGQHNRSASENGLTPSGSQKVKPSVSPKPEALHARAASSLGQVTKSSFTGPNEALADRFAKLRGLGPDNNRPGSRNSISSLQNQPLPSPLAGQYVGKPDLLFSSRLYGPRGMPENGNGPSRPTKLPLDTDLALSMPKPPSPTYSPARNMQTTGNIAPPRHSARSLAGSGSRKSSLGPLSSASSVAPNSTVDYFGSSQTNGNSSPSLARKNSVHMPKDTEISAQMLYDYLPRFEVLLIDFRPREDFDQGHIYTRNVICIEPLTVRQGMSAEELSEGLILSPEEEVDLFNRRDSFDVVVYYDADTRSDDFLARPRTDREQRLKWLHEALDEFNQDRPLQRRPSLLIGGIEAWADLLGNQALVASNTKARTGPARSLVRRPAARDGPMKVQKRRLRDYNPLDPEEERTWRARAKSESVKENPVLATDGGEDEEDVVQDEDGASLPKYPTIEDFNSRFPDAGTLGQQYYNGRPARPPPEAPNNVPRYPSAPPPSQFPPAPARPAPAAPRMSYTGVSDRAVSQNTPAPRTSSQLVPYISPKYLSANLRIPKTGLKNFGSTCYMNATLQALSATIPLTILVMDDGYKNMVQKENWKGSRGLLPEMYSNVVRELWRGNVDFIKPTTFFNFCGRLNSTFKDPSQQEDTQEFFSFVVDCLHEDFNAHWAKPPLRELTPAEEATRERMPRLLVAKTEWDRYTHRENSFLTSIFYGQQSSRVRCTVCNATSTQYDPWALLQVEIPEAREAQLQDCLRNHFGDELLDADNQWTCTNCKVPRRATKKLTITRAPPFLVIGLKRFKTHPRTGEQRKIHTNVRFPLEGLDMGEFILPPPSPQEAEIIVSQHGGREALKTDPALTPPYIYDAYAVVRHQGDTTRSGHYTAAVRDRARGCWRFFNDTVSNDFRPEGLGRDKALDNEGAYLVFWQRRGLGGTGGGGEKM